MTREKPFVPVALYLLPSEKAFWDHLVTRVPVNLDDLINGPKRLTQSLLKVGLLQQDEEQPNLHRLIEARGIVVVEISERRTYALKSIRYNLVRAIQSGFKPDEKESRTESRERLADFISDWCDKNSLEEVIVSSWLMSSDIRSTPSQGSGLVTLIKGTGPLYLTIEGLEAFELQSSEKEGRVVSPRSMPDDRRRTQIPSRPADEAFDEGESVRNVVQHHEQAIERLKEQNRGDQGSIAELNKRIEELKAKISGRETEINRREQKIKLLRDALDC